ncbi:MAG: hypothetical protein J5771_03810 [Bacteroidales bacterium]|nr:hypothetical protein [Bacteroidales bacterium]
MVKRGSVTYFVLFFAIIVLGIGLFYSHNYIESLENQVYQRDSLIREMSFSDELVREYFDIKLDTVNHSRYYSLKNDKKTRVVEYLEPAIVIDGRKLDFDQLSGEYIGLVNKYNKLVRDYNSLVNDLAISNSALSSSKQAVKLVRGQVDSLQTLLNEKQSYLSIIASTYGIKGKTRREGNIVHYSIKGSPQLDSALRIYPYFKDLAVYDGARDAWVISIPNKKRIDTVVEISYKRSSK